MMNINFLYSLLVSLCFTVKFDVNNASKEDYFILNGHNTSAHLYRQNQTIKLFLRSNASYKHLEMRNVTDQFVFEWSGFKVNNAKMETVISEGDLNLLCFDSYTFISPTLDFVKEEVVTISERSWIQNRDINYGFFVLIVIGVGLLLKFDIIAPKVFDAIVKSYAQISTEEPAYVEMTDNARSVWL